MSSSADSMFFPLLVAGRAGALVAVLGGVVWLTGEPFLFPSLGPTAFVLSARADNRSGAAWPVLGGHLWGTGAGLLSYHLLAGGTTLMNLSAPGAASGLCLAASAVLSIILTSALMLCTRAVHPPACATTLIVSLGLLSSLRDGGIILLSVALLFALSRAWPRLSAPSEA